MIKYISHETMLYYIEEFHRIIANVTNGLHAAIHVPHEITNPEKDRDDEHLIQTFEMGHDIGFTAPFIIKIPCADVCCTVSIDLLDSFEKAIMHCVTADDDALYVVSFKDLSADYDYSTGTLNISFKIYCPSRFAEMDHE